MLDPLFRPRSIAVIGASADPKKVGHAVLNNLLRFGFPGAVYPVNPTCTEILGQKAVPTVALLPQAVDLAVIVIPARLVPGALTECADAGIGAAVVISAGFKEAGAAGTMLEQELTAIARARGIRVLGPNCLGLINTANSMNATFAGDMLPRGNIGFFSQSGAMGIAIMDWAIGNNIGFSTFVSLGNKADLSETELIEHLAEDPATGIILGYIEDVVDGRRFLEVAKRATRKKPVILLKSGGTEAGARAASSHTGALAGSDIAFDAAFKQTGVIRAAGVQDLFDTARAFAEGKVPGGNRLLVITNAGGPGIIAADTAERLRVELPRMTKESITAMAARLPPNATVFNPVDVIGDATTERYVAVLEQAVRDPHVDGVLVILTPQAMTNAGETAEAIIRAAGSTDRPIITSFMGEARVHDAVAALQRAAVPNFPYPELAVKAFKRLADHHAWMVRREEQPLRLDVDGAAVQRRIDALTAQGNYQAGEDDAAAILSTYGFRFPRKALARTAQEAAAAARSIGYPVVMKIASPEILHKTDVGGVRLNIRNAKEAQHAFLEITANSRRHMPEATILGVLVSEMVRGGREVILGVTFDRTFGHLLMFGLGGIYVEVLKDVAFRVAPLTRSDAESMVQEVRTVALLRGARGEKAVDVDAVVAALQRLSCLVTDVPKIRELDINPLVVLEQGAIALDSRIIFARPASL